MSGPDPLEQLPVEYLLETSEAGLQDAMVKRLELASAKRREIRELLEEWASERALALVFEWFLKHGAEIAGRLTSSPVIELPAGKPGPMRADEFRESLKKLLESA